MAIPDAAPNNENNSESIINTDKRISPKWNNKMAKIIIGKLESVKRQTDVAIRLFAENDDPIAVHVLASSAFRILRDLAEKDDNNFAREKFKTSINPEKENEELKEYYTKED